MVSTTTAEGTLSSPIHRSELGPAASLLIAAFAAILVNLVAMAITQTIPAGGFRLRVVHHLYDAGHHVAAAVVAIAVWTLLPRLGVRRLIVRKVVVGACLWTILSFVLSNDLSMFVRAYADARYEPLLKTLLAGVVTLALIAGWHFVQGLGTVGRYAGAVIGLALLVSNHVILPNDYPGVHLSLTLAGAALIAAACSGVRYSWRVPRRVHVASWLLLVALATLSVVIRPSQGVLVDLLRTEGSSFAPWVARLHARNAPSAVPIIEGAQWFVPRSNFPPVTPTTPNPLPERPVVLLVTIDALRADLLERKELFTYVPTLTALAAESVSFSNARTPGSQTVYTVTTMFAGTYFSQQYWTTGAPDRSTRATDYLFPHADQTLRFPQVLQAGGIRTVTFASASWLVNSVGVVRGFDEERFVQSQGDKYTLAPDLTQAAIQRLQGHRQGALFLYLHYLDPHAPYNRGSSAAGTQFERYLEEVRLVDTELARLISFLKTRGLWSSTVLIVTADHGEAFGEHGSRFHATTLYDEQLLVPLLIRAPQVKARRIDALVSLIDIGPTILDMFRLATPGHFLGQSLLGFLRGQSPKLTRPIIAEGRLKKSWVFSDGFKLIVDDHTHTVELYNLLEDPDEQVNVYETETTAASRLATLRAFFKTHQIQRDGYEIPYRR